MKHKTSELEGPLLDAAVAKAEGFDYLRPPPQREGWAPSRSWSVAGPIIEREVISLSAPLCVGDYGEWSAFVGGSADSEKGPTPLIAAMRAYVASKLGDVVDLP
jgi:hypothetical protein